LNPLTEQLSFHANNSMMGTPMSSHANPTPEKFRSGGGLDIGEGLGVGDDLLNPTAIINPI